MAWFKTDDKAHGNPKLRAVAEACPTAAFPLLFAWTYAAGQGTDGWLPDWLVTREFGKREWKAVTTIRAHGRAPLIHAWDDVKDQPEAERCSCLADKEWGGGRAGGGWIHDFLVYNPSRAENTVHRAKRKELGDLDLIDLIKRRDGNACRYCLIVVSWFDKKSNRMLCIDHVNPTLAAGADNLVVACTSCNSSKGDATTPEAAGLVLQPPPVDVPLLAAGNLPGWAKGTDPLSIKRAWPDPPADTPTDTATAGEPTDPTTDRTAIGSRSDRRSDRRSTTDRPGDPQPGDNPVHNPADPGHATGDAPPGTTGRRRAPGRGGGGWGGGSTAVVPRAGDVGPAGRRPVVGPATTPRTADSPPTYRKSATSNPPPADEGGPP